MQLENDYKLFCGDSINVLKEFENNSIDSIVTDPPYGISFMNKKWDYDVPKVELWKEVYRVLKPGGHMLCACGTRTQHRMVVNIEDSGFEIRDVITWHYGSGFPKSVNISLAFDKKIAGVKDRAKAYNTAGVGGRNFVKQEISRHGMYYENNLTEEAKKWAGWGTSLKPATEFWTLCRKPLSEKTIAENILKWGTGGININECRIGSDTIKTNGRAAKNPTENVQIIKHKMDYEGKTYEGRFPSNVIFDEFSAEILDEQSGERKCGYIRKHHKNNRKQGFLSGLKHPGNEGYKDEIGGVSRFFYVSKASRKEREEGLETFESIERKERGNNQASRICSVCNLSDNGTNDHSNCNGTFEYKQCSDIKNDHPTVKPINLLRYLIRLITPKGGIVLDAFNGSGSTGCASMLEGFKYIGIDRNEEYINISKHRIEYWKEHKNEYVLNEINENKTENKKKTVVKNTLFDELFQ